MKIFTLDQFILKDFTGRRYNFKGAKLGENH